MKSTYALIARCYKVLLADAFVFQASSIGREFLAFTVRLAMLADVHQTATSFIVHGEAFKTLACLVNASRVLVEPDALLVHLTGLTQLQSDAQAPQLVGAFYQSVVALAKIRCSVAARERNRAGLCLAVADFVHFNSFLIRNKRKKIQSAMMIPRGESLFVISHPWEALDHCFGVPVDAVAVIRFHTRGSDDFVLISSAVSVDLARKLDLILGVKILALKRGK